ncbi:MAG: polysaccharide biosynthesis tyrosine autokinase [Pseudoflavonifractor sp.]|nr:polysaccharide biosynthesis tyrosine autokinase [Alloprevotella sp.]MCM1116585.1 polysaccharide biosynthesis tyrosine autokinase [Pseudoflavonifractor sp.]
MSDSIDTSRENTEKRLSGSAMSLTDVAYLTLHHWPWIILSLAICLGLAYYYILRTPEVYTRSAELLVKDESKGSSLSSDEFSDLGLFQTNTNINNEIITLSSKDLMREVVERLKLDQTFYTHGTFHNNILYGYDLPVKLSVAGFPVERSYSLHLALAKDGKVTISDLEADKEKYDDKTFSGQLGDSIQTPIGRVIVEPSPNYKKGDAANYIVKKVPESTAINYFSRHLKVSMSNDKGTVLKLTLSDQSQQRADEVLTTLIGVYNEAWIRDKNQIAVSTSNFINDRLNVIESELGHVDSDISSYKSANLVPDVQAASSMYMSQSQQNATEMLGINNQLQMTRYIRSYLNADGTKGQLLPANAGINDPTIQAQISEYNDKLLQRNALAEKSSEKNPLVRTLDEQLASQRAAIIGTVDNQIVDLNTQLKGLQRAEAQTISRIASNPTQAKYLLSVERQQKVKESLYLFLLQKREENELSQAFTAYNTRIVNRPGDSGAPVLPNRRNIFLLAFVVGLFIPFGFTYVKEMSNTAVRGRKDVENLTLPFLGEIPQNRGSKKSKKDGEETVKTVVREGSRDVINESFRVLRTNLEFMRSNPGSANIVAITSFNPHSGKSFISLNLAKALSVKDKKVLVIDGDMRHGSASQYVGSPEKGLSDYLSGKVTDLNKVIKPVDDSDHLFVLPTGTIPPNPAELLERPIFKEMIDSLRDKYDYIIIDCPPIEVVADAQIIDRVADRTIFIIRAGLLDRSMLPELEKLYQQKKYTNMAYILNGTEISQGGYAKGYRYGYGYGYGYGYHYGSEASSSKKSK